MRDKAVTNRQIADGAVDSRTVLDNSLTTDDIQDGSLTGNDIQDNTITSNDITDNTITSNDIANNTIQGNDIADNTIQGNDIDEATLDGTQIPGVLHGNVDAYARTILVVPEVQAGPPTDVTGALLTIPRFGELRFRCTASSHQARFSFKNLNTQGIPMHVQSESRDGTLTPQELLPADANTTETTAADYDVQRFYVGEFPPPPGNVTATVTPVPGAQITGSSQKTTDYHPPGCLMTATAVVPQGP
jgi:hypothetical protein